MSWYLRERREKKHLLHIILLTQVTKIIYRKKKYWPYFYIPAALGFANIKKKRKKTHASMAYMNAATAPN